MHVITKNFLKLAVLQLALLGILIVAVPPVSTYAAPAKDNAKQQQDDAKKAAAKKKQQGGQTGHCTNDNNCDLVALYVNPFIRLLSILVGLVVAASLVMGGIQYSASGGDPQKASAAKSRISNTLLAFMAYAFLYAFLNFLVPGGIFNQ